MKNLFLLIVVLIIISCNNNQNASVSNKSNDSSTVITNNTIPTIRQEINPKPVASYFKAISNSLNNWHFSVDVYETKETFHYLMKMEYMELSEADTLKIPNIGIWPRIEIRKGNDDYFCIVGFFDRGNNFKEYKLVSAKDDKLKVKVLHHYGVATYESK
jgi:hypothetical protein